VVRVNSINIEMTVKSPSAFGMPAYGRLTSTGLVASASVVQVSTCARTRTLADMGIALKGAFPGNRAWRPPSC
jgi:hypothetical protein